MFSKLDGLTRFLAPLLPAPRLTAALDYLRDGDTLVVWNLDRLGRSVKDVLTIADDLHARGIGIRILTGKLSGSY
jgi:DNA invertase Pin-like site-specific DNA recombinase